VLKVFSISGLSSVILPFIMPFKIRFRSQLLAVGAGLLFVNAIGLGETGFRKQTEARLLDQAALLCNNCFFGTSDYFYCFETAQGILIGYQRAPVVNWWDKSKNYATKAHPSWSRLDVPQEALRIEYDEKNIWVMRGDQDAVQRAGGALRPFIRESADVRLMQNYKRDVFTNKLCQEAVRSKAH
jgi:hypothetical protein